MAIIKPGTGQVEAMAQSQPMGSGHGQTWYNYTADLNHGGTAGMQAGSTFKAFVGLAALEQGYQPGTVISSPYQLFNVPGIKTCTGNSGTPIPAWNPTNQTPQEGTPTTNMTTAYWKSVNTYFIQLEEKTGLCQPATIAQDFGVTQDSDDGTGKPLQQIASFTLGTNQITPLAMANAYATIASNGVYCKPIEIQSIKDVNGKSYAVPQAGCHSVFPAQYTKTLTSMLQGVISNPEGTGYGMADIGRPAAGKTGTNDSMAMTWFDGYTPNLAAAVWVGNPDKPTTMEDNVTLHGSAYPGGVKDIGKLYGAAASAPIWGEGMQAAVQGLPVVPFDTPAVGSGQGSGSGKHQGGQNGGQNNTAGQNGGLIGNLLPAGGQNGGKSGTAGGAAGGNPGAAGGAAAGQGVAGAQPGG
jgi:membrane peptidoglycan carboxypeptidase